MLYSPPSQVEHPRRWKDVVKVQLPPAFYRIANIIRAYLNRLGKEVDEEDLIYLKKCFALDECPRIDYERYAVAFAHSYFLENFMKAACTFTVELPRPVHRVLDAGCGSGAKTLAYLVSLNEVLRANTKWPIDVTLIDSSRKQLALAEEIIHHIEPDLKQLNISLYVQDPVELEAWEPLEGITDALLLSHVLNENRPHINCLLNKAATAVAGGGDLYILERPKDDVWVEIDKAVGQLAFAGTHGRVQLEWTSTDSEAFPLLADKSLTTGYLAVHFPRRKELMALVRTYFRAWEQQSLSLLEEVFEDQAEYHDKPRCRPPIRGLDAIKRYWEEHVLTQKQIHLQVLDVSYETYKAHVNWQADFFRFERPVHLSGSLDLRVRPGQDRAIELTENYRCCKD